LQEVRPAGERQGSSLSDSEAVTTADGSRAKVDRALELLLQLDDELHEYLDADPIALERQTQPDGETMVIALRVTQLPPIRLSLLVGEVTHQLRSALDHLAYALVTAAGNTPTRRTAFPVLTKRPDGGLRIDGGVTPAALAVIDSLQPYQSKTPAVHPLNVLTELWNIDKHRHLHLTALRSTNTQVFLSAPHGSAMFGGQFQANVVGDGDAIGAFRFPDGTIHPELELIASGWNSIALGDHGPWPKGEPVQLILEALHQYVALNALPRLEVLVSSS